MSCTLLARTTVSPAISCMYANAACVTITIAFLSYGHQFGIFWQDVELSSKSGAA